MTPKKAGQKAAEHSRVYLVQNAMTAFQSLGCLWSQAEEEGALLKFSLTLRIQNGK